MSARKEPDYAFWGMLGMLLGIAYVASGCAPALHLQGGPAWQRKLVQYCQKQGGQATYWNAGPDRGLVECTDARGMVFELLWRE